MNQYYPDEISSPLESLEDILAEHSFDEATTKRLRDICNQDLPIDASLATELESLLGTPASFWLERQRQYDEWKAKYETQESAPSAPTQSQTLE